jgi:hypothetical protein
LSVTISQSAAAGVPDLCLAAYELIRATRAVTVRRFTIINDISASAGKLIDSADAPPKTRMLLAEHTDRAQINNPKNLTRSTHKTLPPDAHSVCRKRG